MDVILGADVDVIVIVIVDGMSMWVCGSDYVAIATVGWRGAGMGLLLYLISYHVMFLSYLIVSCLIWSRPLGYVCVHL